MHEIQREISNQRLFHQFFLLYTYDIHYIYVVFKIDVGLPLPICTEFCLFVLLYSVQYRVLPTCTTVLCIVQSFAYLYTALTICSKQYYIECCLFVEFNSVQKKLIRTQSTELTPEMMLYMFNSVLVIAFASQLYRFLFSLFAHEDIVCVLQTIPA